MTLQASFPLDMSDVATELGIALPLNLRAASVMELAGVSGGSPISFSQLLGKSAASVQDPNGTGTKVSANSGTRSVTFAFWPDGTSSLTFGGSGGSNAGSVQHWWSAAPVADIGSSWWVRVLSPGGGGTNVSGSLAGGAWLQISAGRTITYENSNSNGEAQGTDTIQFSDDGGSSIALAGSLSWWVGTVT